MKILRIIYMIIYGIVGMAFYIIPTTCIIIFKEPNYVPTVFYYLIGLIFVVITAGFKFKKKWLVLIASIPLILISPWVGLVFLSVSRNDVMTLIIILSSLAAVAFEITGIYVAFKTK